MEEQESGGLKVVCHTQPSFPPSLYQEMEQALAIPFIMDLILLNQNSDHRELINYILVSKLWASVAIPILWGYHAGIEHLVYVQFGEKSSSYEKEMGEVHICSVI